MSQHARTGGPARRAGGLWTEVRDWHDARERASFASARGWAWAALVAALFFWMSNPLVFIPGFPIAVNQAVTWTTIVAVLSLPWLRIPRIPWPWLLFYALCVLSLLWTVDELGTDDSLILYFKLTALALVVAANCRPEVVAWGLAAGGVVVASLSMYAYWEGVWMASNEYLGRTGVAGVGTNENILAYTLSLSLAATLATGVPRRLPVALLWSAMLLAQLYGLYRAASGTGYVSEMSVVVAALVLAAWPVLRRARTSVLVGALAGVIALVVGGLLFVTIVLGEELSTFSGRVPLWRAVIGSTMDRAPLLGSGWGAVWGHPWDPATVNEPVLDIYARSGTQLPHGHNFFLDVLPELGLVGVGLALVMVVHVLRGVRASGVVAGGRAPLTGRLSLLVVVSLLVSGITEPMLTVPLGWWSLALVAALPQQRDGSTARAAATRRTPG